MGGDFVRLAVFDNRGTALEALRMLQTNGIVEAHVWPVAPTTGWWNTNLGPHMVTVAKSRIQEARGLLLKNGLLGA